MTRSLLLKVIIMKEFRMYPTDTMIKEKFDRLFIKGPIPYPWCKAASNLGGKALHVGMILWMTSGMTKSDTFKLQLKFFRDWGISKTTLYKSLEKLESKGLIKLLKSRGKTHTVTIIER